MLSSFCRGNVGSSKPEAKQIARYQDNKTWRTSAAGKYNTPGLPIELMLGGSKRSRNSKLIESKGFSKIFRVSFKGESQHFHMLKKKKAKGQKVD